MSQPTAPQTKHIHLQYFAVLREARGCSQETMETQAQTVGDLYLDLQARYGFYLNAEVMRAARNGTFCDWDAALSDGDTLVFIPPVAGG